MIPYGRQDISDDDIRAVDAVLRSDWLTQGGGGHRVHTLLELR
jgi:dTDP-4-amino-4,6-dideoxygalactose transaminase